MLNSALVGHVSGGFLKHPLVMRRYVPAHDPIYNREYDTKLKELGSAEAAGDWEKYIWLHAPPFRLSAFERLPEAITDEQYWRLLASVWIDCRHLDKDRMRWRKVWTASRAARDWAMSEVEHQLFAELHKDVLVYRVCRNAQAARGMAWTFSQKSAAILFRHYEGVHTRRETPLLVTAVIEKQYIRALFHGRRHQIDEVVVLADQCVIASQRPLPKKVSAIMLP